MSSHRAALAGLLLLCVPALAAAQPEEDPRASARMHIGPIYLTPTLALTNLGADTNVFNQAGEQKADFTFSVSPHVDIWLPFARRAMFQSSVTAGIDYYHTFASERSFNPDVSGRAEVYFNRLTLFGGVSYLNSRQRPSFEIDVRSRRVENGVHAGAELRLLRKLYLEVAGRQGTTDFDADAVFEGTSLQQTLNRDVRTASVASKWRFTPLTTLVLRGEAQSDRFEFSPVRDADSVRLVAGAEFRPRALVSGTGYVGYRRFQTLNDAVPDFDGLVASASLSYTLLGSTVFGFTADRDVAYSFEPTQPYYVVDGYGLNIQRHLAGRLDATVGATRYLYAYRDFTVPAGAPRTSSIAATAERVDTTWNYTGSIGYRVSRETRIGLGASYYDRRSSTKESRDYSGLRVGLLVEYGTR